MLKLKDIPTPKAAMDPTIIHNLSLPVAYRNNWPNELFCGYFSFFSYSSDLFIYKLSKSFKK